MTTSKTSQTAAPAPVGAVPPSLPLPPVAGTEGLGGNAGGRRPLAARDDGAPRSLDMLAGKISEAYLDTQIRHITDDLGLLRYHTADSRRSPAGFPDLVIVGKDVLYRELKRERGHVTSAQERWLAALAAAGQDADVWRPSDLLDGRIARELAALAGVTR